MRYLVQLIFNDYYDVLSHLLNKQQQNEETDDQQNQPKHWDISDEDEDAASNWEPINYSLFQLKDNFEKKIDEQVNTISKEDIISIMIKIVYKPTSMQDKESEILSASN
jgi:hypothetical protein